MIRRTWALAALTLLLSCAPALAAPATVDLRVEGSSGPVFEGPVTTDGRDVTSQAGGTHKCDGTNGGANSSPGPTMTSALDDASHTAGFTWDGTYDSGYDDYFVSRIGGDTNTGAPDFQPYWGLFVNYLSSPSGGCQTRVSAGDGVQFLYGSFGQPLLELSGTPAKAATGEAFEVNVVQHDGNGAVAPAPGATMAGQTTGAAGRATVSFDSPGVKRFKATRADAVRSNAQEVCVYASGSADCDTFVPGVGGGPASDARDTKAPLARIGSIRNGARYRRGPRLLRGSVQEDRGLHQVYFRLRRIAAGGCRWFSGARADFTRARTCASPRFARVGDQPSWSYLLPRRLERGRYILEAKALDRAWNAGRARVRFTVLGP